MAAERNNVELIIQRDLFPDPFRSALMENGVRDGKDLTILTIGATLYRALEALEAAGKIKREGKQINILEEYKE